MFFFVSEQFVVIVVHNDKNILDDGELVKI